MSPDDGWARLLEVLGTAGLVSEPLPGRVIWTDDISVEIRMTPSDWSSWYGTVMGDLEYTADLVLAKVRSAAEARIRYLVFQTYDLHPSSTPELPDPWADMNRRVEEYKRAHPDATFGWYAHRPDRDESP
jgi:hypothetical protein